MLFLRSWVDEGMPPVRASPHRDRDTATVTAVAAGAGVAITAENHSVIGGLGSAVAETLAEAAVGCPLHRVGLRDTFAEGALSGPYLFEKYGLSTKHLIDTAWAALGERGPGPAAPVSVAAEGEYSPV
jgi:transketolase